MVKINNKIKPVINITNMKRAGSILVLFFILLTSCTNQQNGRAQEDNDDAMSEFEKKQQEAFQRMGTAEKPNDYKSKVPKGLDFRLAAEKATKGVVHITSKFEPRQSEGQANPFENMPPEFRDFFGDQFRFRQPDPSPRMGSGSGVIVSDDGYIVTNNHVIQNAGEIRVVLWDNRDYEAEVIGSDPATDIALIKIDAKDLNFIPFGNSDSVVVGEWVLAVGNPFNLSSTVTAGIVSAKARNINIIREQSAIESFIQTDAVVNPGNSGGALVNLDGKLIGINTAIASPTGVYAGYAFAVPVQIVTKVIDDLLEYGIVQRGYLGVFIRSMNADLADELDVDVTQGVYVDSIMPNSAAREAGIKKGDVIVSVNEREVNNTSQLQAIIGGKAPGDKVNVEIVRNGSTENIKVTLKNRQGSTAIVEKEDLGILSNIGVEVSNLSDEEKESLNIKYGIRVARIMPGTIRNNTSMRTGFIILRADRKSVNSVEEFQDIIEGKSGEGIMIEGIYPGSNEVVYYAFPVK